MKTKTILPLFLIVVAITACAQSNTFKITGQIDNIADGTVILLNTVEGTGGRILEADTVRSGSFSFEVETDSLRKFMLTAKGGEFSPYFRSLWTKPGSNTKITGDGYYFLGWKIKSNVKEQQEEDKYIEIYNRFPELDSLNSVSDELRNKNSSLTSGPEKEEVMKKLEAITLQQRSIFLTLDSVLYSFMEKEPVSQVWIDRLNQYSMRLMFDKNYKYADKLKKLYERLTPEQKESESAQSIYRYLYPLTVVKEKQPMAEGLFFDPENNQKDITEYKGKYLLLDFWSVGCAPCIAAFPEMKEIHEAHQDKLTVISISTDTRDMWQEGLKRHQLPWINLNDFKGMSDYAARYGIRGIPTYVLISPDGIVEKIWSGYGKGSLKEKLKDIF
ncbi:Thiol-disulfide oxidoreductase ResA [anaerobic digester metagenome]